MTLYELTLDGLRMRDLLEEREGELTPDDEAYFDALLAGGKDKLEAAAMVLRGLEAEEDVCREEAERLVERAGRTRANAERLKSRMLAALDTLYGGRVKTSLFTVWGQTSAKTVHFDAKPEDLVTLGQLFPDAVRVQRSLDRAKLLEMYKGGALPECVQAEEREGIRYLRVK